MKNKPTALENAAKIKEYRARENISDDLLDYFCELLGEKSRHAKAIAEDEMRIARTVRKMPITSGYNFEGYKIKRYGGYVSGDEVVTLSSSYFFGMQVGTGINKDTINDAIVNVRRVAINEMKQAAAEIGCNAVIGLDFDYINIDLGHQDVDLVHIILTANGTAVEIELL